MGWLRLVGSLKVQVSFAEYRLFYRALLQKRPTFLGSLLIVATSYHNNERISHKYVGDTTAWMSHVTHMNESCHTYEWVMSHTWMSHVTHMNETQHTSEWVMLHIWMRLSTLPNESCYTYEWDSAHFRMSHVSHMNKARHEAEWVPYISSPFYF